MRTGTVNALERDFRNAPGHHIVARSEAYGSERGSETQRSRRSGIAGHPGGSSDQQILLVGDGCRDRIGDRRSTGRRLIRKNDPLAAIGRVSEETDVASGTGPVIGGRPGRCFGHLDIVHIIRQAGILAPSPRINRSQYAERIVKGPRFDGRGTRLQSVGLHIRVRCGDSVGDRGVQEQRVRRVFSPERKYFRDVFRRGSALLFRPGSTASQLRIPAVRFGDCETKHITVQFSIHCRVFRTGGRRHGCHQSKYPQKIA